MESGLIARLVIVAASVVLAVWILIPTFAGEQVQAEIEAYAARDAEDEAPAEATPWYVRVLPNAKVNRGLDLQGGIDLTLEVQTQEAVLATVQRDITPLKQAAARQGVALADVRRERGRAALLVAPGPNVTLEQVRTLLSSSFRYYA